MQTVTTLSGLMLRIGVVPNISGLIAKSSSLFRILPFTERRAIQTHFGTAFHGREKSQKYSDCYHLFDVGGLPITLYMSHGEWRFGTNSDKVTTEIDAVLRNIEAILKG